MEHIAADTEKRRLAGLQYIAEAEEPRMQQWQERSRACEKQPRITPGNSCFDCWPQVSVVFTPCSSGSGCCSSSRRRGAKGKGNGWKEPGARAAQVTDLLQKFSYQTFLPFHPFANEVALL